MQHDLPNRHSFRRIPACRFGVREIEDHGIADRLAFPAQSSVLDERALQERIVPQYELPTIASCRFLTRGDADVYRLVANDRRRFYLKAYRPPHALALAEAEAQLTADLVARQFPAALPVSRRDGAYATAVNASEGIRPVLLWTEAPGTSPGSEPTAAEAIGRTIGHLHNVCDSLNARYDLPVKTGETLAQLLPYAIPFLEEKDADLAVACAEWGRRQMNAWPKTLPEFGICHEDLAGVNIRVDPTRGVSLFDFGECGYTWRAADFLRFHPGTDGSEKRQARWVAFGRGYSNVRTLPEHMDQTLPVLRLMRHLGFMGKCAGSCPLRMGTESPDGFLPRHLQWMREHIQAIPELREHLTTNAML